MLLRMASCVGLMAVVAALTLGCGGGGKNPGAEGIVPASGTLTLAGVPLEGASVTFSDDAGRGGSAFSRQGGKFAICTFGDGDGTLPGEYTVMVSKIEVDYGISNEEIARRESSGEPIPKGKETYFVPTKYGSKSTSDIRVTVPPKGSKTLTIDLQDGDKTPTR